MSSKKRRTAAAGSVRSPKAAPGKSENKTWKEAETALRKAIKTLKSRIRTQSARIRLQSEAIAHLAEGVMLIDGAGWPQSTIVFVNEAICKMTGYTADELIGQPRSILLSNEPDSKELKRIRRELAAGNSCQTELVQYRKDGTAYDAEVSFTPLKNFGGRRTTIVSIQRDITERKKAEQALLESERRFRQMADHSPVMIWTTGLDRLCTWVNKAGLEFTGRTLEQELGSGWADWVHSEDVQRCLDTYVACFDARKTFAMEYRVRRADGEWRWVIDGGSPLYEGEVFCGYIGSCIDVTDRRKAEDALRQREGLLQAILNTAGDAIITTDLRGIIVAANPATERMFGYKQHELVGQNVKLLMPPKDREWPDGGSREVIAVRKDGSTFPTEVSVGVIEHLGLRTSIHRDITARKQTELDLEQQRKNLRTMSSELMLAEERERRKLAQDLHDGLGQALFRARMKLDQPDIGKPVAREVGKILEDVGKMVNTLTFELSPPVLRQLGFRPAIQWLARDMKERYALQVQIHDDGQNIPLDERGALVLFRSVRELLINVAKHAQSDLAILSLRKSDQNLQVAITDHGKGFNPAKLSRQVESGHFGLFSIRERLEYLGGTMTIQSAPGEGAKVALTFPLLATRTAGKGR